MSTAPVIHRSLRPRALDVLPVILGLLALLVGIWSASINVDMSRICEGFGSEEGTSYHTELAAWPLGAVNCEVTARDGSTRESTFMPWREYFASALFALAVGLASAAVSRRRTHRASWLGCAGLLVGASFVLFFFAG